VEQDLKELIARCCGGDIAPSSLRERVKVRLEQVVVTSGADEIIVESRSFESESF